MKRRREEKTKRARGREGEENTRRGPGTRDEGDSGRERATVDDSAPRDSQAQPGTGHGDWMGTRTGTGHEVCVVEDEGPAHAVVAETMRSSQKEENQEMIGRRFPLIQTLWRSVTPKPTNQSTLKVHAEMQRQRQASWRYRRRYQKCTKRLSEVVKAITSTIPQHTVFALAMNIAVVHRLK